MHELRATLDAMGLVQLLFAFAFIGGYSVALSGLAEGRGRRRAALLAALAAIGFAASTDPWVHGVLLMTAAVAGLGVFLSLVCAVCRVFDPAQRFRPEALQATQPNPVPARDAPGTALSVLPRN